MPFGVGFIFKVENFEKNLEIERLFGEAVSEFEILSILGNGSYGRVNCVKHVQTGKRYFF